jgi:ElaB/YqjD/DUF883 family membrane-anchored ribosome-binding protein
MSMPRRSRSRTRKKRETRVSREMPPYRRKRSSSSTKSKMAQENQEVKEMKTIEGVLKDLRKTFDNYLPQIRNQVRQFQRKTAKTTVERPVLALGAAFLAGMALGIALSRPRH